MPNRINMSPHIIQDYMFILNMFYDIIGTNITTFYNITQFIAPESESNANDECIALNW